MDYKAKALELFAEAPVCENKPVWERFAEVLETHQQIRGDLFREEGECCLLGAMVIAAGKEGDEDIRWQQIPTLLGLSRRTPVAEVAWTENMDTDIIVYRANDADENQLTFPEVLAVIRPKLEGCG